MQRRHFLLSSAASGIALAHPLARAQGLPDTARILAGFAPGGTVDVTARRVADRLRDVLAKSVVVENRTGAGGQIALSGLKTSPTDGLTLLVRHRCRCWASTPSSTRSCPTTRSTT
jgi:tripartite-type tricarboxylate transporter receptor subunit TctC